MSGWTKKKLSELCDEITVGFVGKMSDQYVKKGVPFLRSQDIFPGFINVADIKYISTDFHKKIKKSQLKPGDVAVVRTGYPGTAAVVPDSLPEANCADLVILRPGPHLHPRYLAYVFNSPWGKAHVSGRLVGAAQQHFNVKTAQLLEIPNPDFDTQCRIASILGAYDDLIEVNRRRVKLLEEMARGLFEEWFVRFRFPGHETVPLLDTPNGKLPEGWRFLPLRNIAVLRSGFAFQSSSFVEDGEYSLVTIKHVHDGELVPPFQSKLGTLPSNMPAHCHIKVGDILLSLTGNVGRACLAWGENLLLNQRVAKVEWQRPDLRAFTYMWLRHPHTLKLLQNNSNGVAQQNLSPIQTMDLPIVTPPQNITEQFEKAMGTNLDAMVNGFITVENLQTQRDLLLPRLISGQLSVEAADQMLAAAE